jgi:hypothetical protein
LTSTRCTGGHTWSTTARASSSTRWRRTSPIKAHPCKGNSSQWLMFVFELVWLFWGNRTELWSWCDNWYQLSLFYLQTGAGS